MWQSNKVMKMKASREKGSIPFRCIRRMAVELRLVALDLVEDVYFTFTP